MIQELTPTQLKERLDNSENLLVVDVREIWELNITRLEVAQHISMNDIPQRAATEIPKDQPVVLLCRTGSRSMRVAQFLATNGWNAENLYNLKGGILAWAREVDPTLPQNY